MPHPICSALALAQLRMLRKPLAAAAFWGSHQAREFPENGRKAKWHLSSRALDGGQNIDVNGGYFRGIWSLRLEFEMIKVPRQILVHLDSTKASALRLEIALGLAEQWDAELAALYAVTPALVTLSYPPDIAAAATNVALLDAECRERAARAFQAALPKSWVAATWASAEVMSVSGVVAKQALYADLLILGQPDPGDPAAARLPPSFVSDVLIESGRPALVIPFIGTPSVPGKRVVIAWKDTREAARSMYFAWPFLHAAESVHVIAWGDDSDGVEGDALKLRTYMTAHGVRAEWHVEAHEPEKTGEMLLSRTADLGADLLIMGCYGHGRLREWVLGGTTRSVLDAMTIPVLMAH